MLRLNILFFLVICLPLVAGVSDGYYNDPQFNFNSLLNPDQVNMHHSYTFQSGVNSQGEGYYLNMYTNHLNFNLSPKLDFKVDLHFINFGSMSVNNNFNIEGNNDNSSQVVPEFEMEWRPTDNMKISFGYQRGVERGLFWQRENNSLFDD
ncbi:MAG: hypothetical protein K9N06_09625 [Candidatus Cloacimonetes bacterium]|nr:hypothetical protein [Candidatus Cloacimonadota bacterium]